MPVSPTFRTAVVAVLFGLAVLVPTGAWAASSQQTRAEGYVGDGLYLRERDHPGPVRSVEVHVQPGAGVEFVPVLSGALVNGGREVVSTMCDRVGGVVCVNANFTECPACSQPFGGIVQDGVLVRSPSSAQDQVSVIDGRFSASPWEFSAQLVVREAGAGIDVDGLNRALGPDDVVLYTSRYAASTGAPAGSYEVVVGATQALVTGAGVRQRVELWRTHTDGDARIPEEGFVISARGRGAAALWGFVDGATSSAVDLVTTTPDGLEQSFAGHPVLLRDGERVALDAGDGKVVHRHPRTVIGWDDLGSTWLVVVDGRQGHSRGMTLAEVTDHLVALGARHGVNLDGGGSSTMVTHCPSESGWCLRNRPSDGAERAVPVALAIRPVSPAPPPPPPPEPQPQEPPAAETVTVAAVAPTPDTAPTGPPAAEFADAHAGDADEAAVPATPVAERSPPDPVEPAAAPATAVPAPSVTATTTAPGSEAEQVAAAGTQVEVTRWGSDGRPGPSVTPAVLAGVLVALDALALFALSGSRGRGGLPSTPGSGHGSGRSVRSPRLSRRRAAGA